jgi:hypothetical protein
MTFGTHLQTSAGSESTAANKKATAFLLSGKHVSASGVSCSFPTSTRWQVLRFRSKLACNLASALGTLCVCCRCFLTLTQALSLGYGGNPYGPAGTGKTESVKSLGLALGRQVRTLCLGQSLSAAMKHTCELGVRQRCACLCQCTHQQTLHTLYCTTIAGGWAMQLQRHRVPSRLPSQVAKDACLVRSKQNPSSGSQADVSMLQPQHLRHTRLKSCCDSMTLAGPGLQLR